MKAWNVAKSAVEIFAETVSDLSLSNRLLKHLLATGWTFEEVDEWLAGMPKGKDGFWVKARLRFNTEHGRGEALAKKLCKEVRKNPEDLDGVFVLLDALYSARFVGEKKLELSWMPKEIRSKLATDAEEIARKLKRLENWEEAKSFYERAIDTPLTEEEVRRLRMSQIPLPPKKVRAMFEAGTRDSLAECLLELGRNAEAQKWMQEADDIRKKHNIDRNARFAGMVQGASGQRVIEGRIKEEEKDSESDPEYWRERAQYYRGRKEAALEEEALLKGLALCEPQLEPNPPTKGHMDMRGWLLANYAHFLRRQSRIVDAAKILRTELQQAPACSGSAKQAASVLATDFEKQVKANDEILWRWLGNRPLWDYTEERLLWQMLENADRDSLNQHFTRAEEMTQDADPSRALTLGWIMNRLQCAKRSIPLLKQAVEKAEDEEFKKRASFELFSSYLDTGDWKHAEALIPVASNRLNAGELPRWCSRVAANAAKTRARDDAMRLWGRVSNLCPCRFDGMEDFVGAGLGSELKTFYEKMRKRMPLSDVPDKALAALEEFGVQ